MLLSYDHTAELKIKSSSLYLNYYSSYTALTALGIRQEVENIMANVFYSTFLNVFYSCHVFFIFPGTFFTSMGETHTASL